MGTWEDRMVPQRRIMKAAIHFEFLPAEGGGRGGYGSVSSQSFRRQILEASP
jgi:hypothetical protein